MHYFLIAGEASGDLHASRLIYSLKKRDPQARFTFIGGDRMAAATGTAPLVHYSKTAFMGFSEVIRHLGEIMKIMKQTLQWIKEARPDCLILIDYPGFNLKIAGKAKKWRRDLPVFYYISPKIWAWKSWRVKKIRRYVDRMFSILPFEKEWYRNHRYEIDYVGNPSLEEVDAWLAKPFAATDKTSWRPPLGKDGKEHEGQSLESSFRPDRPAFLEAHKLRDRNIIALLPGSRYGEIKNNLPVMLRAAERFPQCAPVIALAPGIDREFYSRFGRYLNFTTDTYALLSHARAALVTSGTATLETALFGVPQVVCYRANGSALSYRLMKSILNVRYVSLPNLITDNEIVPEMLLQYCTPELVGDKLEKLLGDTSERASMIGGYNVMRGRLASSGALAAPENTAAHIINALK